LPAANALRGKLSAASDAVIAQAARRRANVPNISFVFINETPLFPACAPAQAKAKFN